MSRATRTCSHEGCERKLCAKGLCNGHWQQQHRGEELRTIRYKRGNAVTREEAKQRKADWHLEHAYGLTRLAWDNLFASQGGVCAICRSDKPGSARGWATDHDHATGAIRGILCQRCNRALGAWHDDPTLLHRALQYLAGQ